MKNKECWWGGGQFKFCDKFSTYYANNGSTMNYTIVTNLAHLIYINVNISIKVIY